MSCNESISTMPQARNVKATWISAILTALPFIMLSLIAAVCMVLRHMLPNISLVWLSLLVLLEFLMIAGCIRELRAERRPDWLATWIPAAMVVPSGPVMSLAIYQKSSSYLIVLAILAYLMAGVICAWALRSSSKSIGIIILVTLIDIALVYAGTSAWLVTISIIGFLALLNTAAMKLFAGHRSGNVVQSALFLFGFYFLCYNTINTIGDEFNFSMRNYHTFTVDRFLVQENYGPFLLSTLLAGATIILCSHMSNERLKLAIPPVVGIPVIIVTFMYWWSSQGAISVLLLSLPVASAIALLVGLPPMLFRKACHRKRPQSNR